MKHFLLCSFVLTVILAVLFHGSFERNKVLFANDGPLGANANFGAEATPNGQWQPNQWLGTKGQGTGMTLSGLLMVACMKLRPLDWLLILVFLGIGGRSLKRLKA